MKVITYAGARLTTGSDIAIAVLNFCAALADDGSAETIDIPILAEDGSRKFAMLLVGPASQIVAEDVESPFHEVIDADVLADLGRRTTAHRPTANTQGSNHHDVEAHRYAWAHEI